MIRTRFAPSPTGFMHIGNLRTALYEFLVAKHSGGAFILRIEDTDQGRLVEGSTEVIYNTLKIAGLQHDEGPDVGGDYGPYIQSQRKNDYLLYAKELVAKGTAYYCFCTKERLDTLHGANDQEGFQYDRHCLHLSKEEIEANLAENTPFIIRQLIPEGKTTFVDEVFGEITVDNDTLDDQVLIKSDGLPTYNFANVVDDHLMKITHVIRGSEYLSSTPKYNLLYDAFGWDIPTYMHLPLILNHNGEKLSKRKGDASFEDLLAEGFLPEAIVNFIALLGWSPTDNREFFTLEELIQAFDPKGLSKSPSIFDLQKLTWMNGEYMKKMDPERFYVLALPYLEKTLTRTDLDLKKLSGVLQSRVNFVKEVVDLVDFFNCLPDYDTSLFVHKKMKTDEESSLATLTDIVPMLENIPIWAEDGLHDVITQFVTLKGLKNSQVLWPIRTAVSGKPTSPCGAIDLMLFLGKEESIARIKKAIQMLNRA